MSVAAVSPWAARRSRAQELRERHAYAAELLDLYLALMPVQEEAWLAARVDVPGDLASWTAARVLPEVVAATRAAGPPALRDAVGDVRSEALRGWLAGEQLSPVARYAARASLGPVLEAVGGDGCAREGTAEICPRCGGLPQLSWLAASGETLVTGPRSLLCSRCAFSWTSSRSACPACGERDEARLEVLAESWEGLASGNGHGEAPPVFPHLRITGCSTCRRYLIEVDMARDPRAVPEVDELAALPLDLYAADRGMRKLTPNLMGF